jgi:hypothetical protein
MPNEKLPEPTRVEMASAGGVVRVALQRPDLVPTGDQALWVAIRNRAEAISFNRYREFIDRLLCLGKDAGPARCGPARERSPGEAGDLGSPSVGDWRDELGKRPTIHGMDAYALLHLATQAFLIFEAGVVIKPTRDPATGHDGPDTDVPGLDDAAARLGRDPTLADIQAELEDYLGTAVGGASGRALPYLKRIVSTLVTTGSLAQVEQVLPYCLGILRNRFTCPSLLELIWSYWHEEAMLVQTLNAIALRFQNRRVADRDPLAQLELDPLRPLNNLLWGYLQDEPGRLSVLRRAYEYDHHYGISLHGKAVPALRSADSRSKFIEAFHNVLYRAAVFYREDANTTVIADGFPLLNAIKEAHLVLAEGAHNQFGDLPWTARVEMLIQMWLLSRPELREFIRGRAMVPYLEDWMGQVDAMKKLQGWTDTSVTHFHDLARHGEQIVLSLRYGDWSDVADQEQAKAWARFWKQELQGYLHAYRAATGVDLATAPVDASPPSAHLRTRLAEQARRAGGT